MGGETRRMERWARQKNIERLERALAAEPDPDRKRVLCDILRSERARLDEIECSEAEATPRSEPDRRR